MVNTSVKKKLLESTKECASLRIKLDKQKFTTKIEKIKHIRTQKELEALRIHNDLVAP